MAAEPYVAGGIVVVVLAAFKLVQFMWSRSNGKSNGGCAWTKEQAIKAASGLELLGKNGEELLKAQREFNRMFGEWLAREEGRREALHRTGEHVIPE